MFRAKTVFVLGAGASQEVGLPVGDMLLQNICKLIDIKYEHYGPMKSGDLLVSNALKIKLDESPADDKYGKCIDSAWQILRSSEQAISIDNIVDALEDSNVELMAKLGIIKAIHDAEGMSSFFTPKDFGKNNYDLRSFGKTWYSHLTKIICENRLKSDISNIFENLAFVSFNYDRCIENYLPYSIANYYGMEPHKIEPIFEDVQIHRPYGIAGKLPWQSGEGQTAPFGGGTAEQLAGAANQIRTFTQGMEDTEPLKSMQNDLQEAERIIFLGSAFHRQNLKLLQIDGNPDVEILATAHGVSDSDARVIKNELGDIFGIQPKNIENQITLAKVLCEPFFREHWRTITAKPLSSTKYSLQGML